MTKTNVQSTPSNSQRHDTPNNKTHVIKFRVTAEEKASLELDDVRFERSGRGQEPSRGHKFSILENFLSIRDFTSAMHLHFRSDLVGACLPQTLLMVRT